MALKPNRQNRQKHNICITMTLSQGYRQTQAAKHEHPCPDYPYIGISDEDEEETIKRLSI